MKPPERPPIVVESVPVEERPEFDFTPYIEIYNAVIAAGKTVFVSTEGWTERQRQSLESALYAWAIRHGHRMAVRKGSRHQRSGVYIWVKGDGKTRS